MKSFLMCYTGKCPGTNSILVDVISSLVLSDDEQRDFWLSIEAMKKDKVKQNYNM